MYKNYCVVKSDVDNSVFVDETQTKDLGKSCFLQRLVFQDDGNLKTMLVVMKVG